MINAVCFNPHVFNPDTVERITSSTGGEVAGYLGDPSVANCIRSFPDGSLYYGHVSEDTPVSKRTIDCRHDIERFIYVNRFRKTANLHENNQQPFNDKNKKWKIK